MTYERCDSCRGDATAGPDGEHLPISRVRHVSFDTAHATAPDPLPPLSFQGSCHSTFDVRGGRSREAAESTCKRSLQTIPLDGIVRPHQRPRFVLAKQLSCT